MACRVDKGREELFQGLPSQFDEMLRLIDGWVFDTEPDYKKLKEYIIEVQRANGFSGKERYDWDDETYSNTTLTPRRSPSARDLIAYGTIEE